MAEFKHLEIDREKGSVKIDGMEIASNATALTLRIDGSLCELEITLSYSGAARKWERSPGDDMVNSGD